MDKLGCRLTPVSWEVKELWQIYVLEPLVRQSGSGEHTLQTGGDI